MEGVLRQGGGSWGGGQGGVWEPTGVEAQDSTKAKSFPDV